MKVGLELPRRINFFNLICKQLKKLFANELTEGNVCILGLTSFTFITIISIVWGYIGSESARAFGYLHWELGSIYRDPRCCLPKGKNSWQVLDKFKNFLSRIMQIGEERNCNWLGFGVAALSVKQHPGF
jgi:hypothetical protein